MKNTLKQLLYEYFPIEVTKQNYLSMKKYVKEFELRTNHIEALNTALLGINKIYFLPKDVSGLFNIFNIDARHFKEIVHSASSIDTSRYVTSDTFNILIIWMAHRTRLSSLSIKEKEDMQVLLFKILHYKFFTSIVNYNLPYGADEATMSYTINELSGKFYIKRDDTPTWALVIEDRSKDIISPASIHDVTIKNFSPDEDILYVITDAQTRIRKQLVTIIYKFHENKRAGKKIISSTLVGEIDGERVLRSISSSLDGVAHKVSANVLNLNEFIDHELINIATVLTKNFKSDMLNSLLVNFSEMAVNQQKNGDHELTKGTGNNEIIYGYALLISYIIQKTYRMCMLDSSINVKSKIQILDKTRTIYRSSRINDRDILIVKNSIDALVNKYSDSKRTATNASLKLGFITYVMLLSMKYM